MGRRGEVEGYWIEWARMRPSCRGRFGRRRSEALDVDSDEAPAAIAARAPLHLFHIDLRQLETLPDVIGRSRLELT